MQTASADLTLPQPPPLPTAAPASAPTHARRVSLDATADDLDTDELSSAAEARLVLPAAFSFIYNLPMSRVSREQPTPTQQRIGAGLACAHIMLCDRAGTPIFSAPLERRSGFFGAGPFETMVPVDPALGLPPPCNVAPESPLGSHLSFASAQQQQLTEQVGVLVWVWARGPLDTEALCQRIAQSLNQAVAEYALESQLLRLVRAPPAPELTAMLARAVELGSPLVRPVRTGTRLPRWMLPHLAQEVRSPPSSGIIVFCADAAATLCTPM
jgi:hypothetical protein